MTAVLDVRGVHKVYGEGEREVRAVDGVDLVVQPGEYVALMGASGSGKSTMMHILGCLDVPSAGSYLLDGTDVASLSERQLSVVRNQQIGFVFQSFNLVPRMSARANVDLPMLYAGVGVSERRARSAAALEMVGLVDRADHEPNQLSGGQQQRVAVARALVNAPALILADEPTGNLDKANSDVVAGIFQELAAGGQTIVMVTHDAQLAARAARQVRMEDGQVVADVRVGT